MSDSPSGPTSRPSQAGLDRYAARCNQRSGQSPAVH